MAVFDRQPPRVAVSPGATLNRLTRASLDSPTRRNSRFLDATALIQLEDDDVYGDSTDGAMTLTLPKSGLVTNRTLTVMRWAGANTITVECAAGDTLALGGTSLTLTSIGAVAILKAVEMPAGGTAWMRHV